MVQYPWPTGRLRTDCYNPVCTCAATSQRNRTVAGRAARTSVPGLFDSGGLGRGTSAGFAGERVSSVAAFSTWPRQNSNAPARALPTSSFSFCRSVATDGRTPQRRPWAALLSGSSLSVHLSTPTDGLKTVNGFLREWFRWPNGVSDCRIAPPVSMACFTHCRPTTEYDRSVCPTVLS